MKHVIGLKPMVGAYRCKPQHSNHQAEIWEEDDDGNVGLTFHVFGALRKSLG